MVTMTDAQGSHTVDALIFYGGAIVNMLKPGTDNTFSDYAKQLQGVKRLDKDIFDEVSLAFFALAVRPDVNMINEALQQLE